MILGQLRIGARQAKNAPLVESIFYLTCLKNIIFSAETLCIFFHQAFLLSNRSEILEPALTVPLAAIHKDLKGYQVNTLDVRKANNTQNKYQKTSDIFERCFVSQ